MSVAAVRLKLNGQTYNLTSEDGETYTWVGTAPPQPSGMNNSGEGPGVGENAAGLGYYPVTVEIEDDAGNITTVDPLNSEYGEFCKLKVYETVLPVTAYTYPTAGARVINNKPSIQITFTDGGSGIKTDTARLSIDGGSEIVLTLAQGASASEYTATHVPANALADGTHTLSAYCYDWDGNKSSVVTINFVVDTVDPSLSITSPDDGIWIKTKTFTVTGVTNDLTSSPVEISLALNGAPAGTAEVDPDTGAFSIDLTGVEGTNTYTVTATDAAGRKVSITRTIKIDTGAPVVTLFEGPAEAVLTGAQITFRIKATD